MAKTRVRFLAASILTLLASASLSTAQTVNILQPVLPTTPSWNIDANWSLGRVPGATDELLINLTSFAAGPSFTLDSDFTLQTLSFDTAASAVGLDASSTGASQTLTLTGVTTGAANALGGTDLIATSTTTSGVITLGGTSGEGMLTVALGAEGTINVANPGADLVFGPDSSISGGFDLTKTGAGTLTLSAANGYTGNTIINAGTLNINSDAALGAAPSSASSPPNITFNGGTLQLAATAGAINLNGNRNIAIATGATATFDTNGASNSLGIGGVISGGGGLTKVGAGTLTLTGSATNTIGNTYTGATTVNGGVLVLDFSVANTYFNIISTSSNLVMGGGALALVPYGGADPIYGLYGAQVFSGTTINPGASAIYTEGSNATYVSSVFLGSITRQLGGTVDFANLANSTFTTSGTANTILTNNGVAFATVGGSDWAATVAINTYISGASANNPGFAVVGGSAIPGFYSASTTSSLSGNADIAAGVANTSLPSGVTTISSLRFNQPQATAIAVGNGDTLVTGGILVTAAVGANLSRISSGALEGPAGEDLVVIQNNPASALEIDSAIADNTTATGLTKSGPGELILTGSNTYTGGTIVNGGTLNINADAALGGAPAAPITNLTFNASSTLQLAASAGAVTLNANRNISIPGQSTVTFDTNGAGNSLVIGGVISGSGGSLIKSGGGSLTLSGANTFTGPTTVNGGELHASATGTLSATSGIMVNATAMLELDAPNALGSAPIPSSPALGTGSLLGVTDVTLDNGGLLAAGANAGDSAAIGLGLLTLTGSNTNLDFLSTTITLNLNAFVSNGHELTIIGWNGGPGGIVADGTADRFIVNQDLSFLGTLSNIQFNLSGVLIPAAEIPLGNGEFQIVPEPASCMTALLGATTALGLRRRARTRKKS